MFEDAKKVWQRLVTDFAKQQDENDTLLMVATPISESSQQVKWDWIDTALLGLTAFWLTPRGFRKRIDYLSNNIVYNTVNTAMLEAATIYDAEWIQWITMDDDAVCHTCDEYGRGGYNGYYRVGQAPPPPPVHPNCRCHYVVIFNTPAPLLTVTP